MAALHCNTTNWSASCLPAPQKFRLKSATRDDAFFPCSGETKERVRKFLDKAEISVSSYDTAWVAMVPCPNSSRVPCFPMCLDWLLDNQHRDGSWSPPHFNSLLMKDALLSTLASVVALKRWGLGEEHIRKGLQFIESNFSLAKDGKQKSPIGFDLTFSGMIEYAKDLDIQLPLKQEDVDDMLYKRDLEIKRCLRSNSEASRAFLAYVSEGIGRSQNWVDVMKYQRKNGSLFNSPSTTASALTYLQNDGCLNYLCSLVEKFGNAVPAIYPFDICARLCMVDTLERLGIDRHFRTEIQSVLEVAYRYWVEREEEIFLEPSNCAMAFWILRIHGYDVSSDPLTHFIGEKQYFNSLEGYIKNIGVASDLYKASQVLIHQSESDIEGKASWISRFLKEESTKGYACRNKYSMQEVDNALKFPERIAVRRNLKHYDTENVKILKTSYCYAYTGNKELLKLAVEDFNTCQSLQREEVKYLERWVIESKLDTLKFARQKLAYCFFSAATTFSSPELSDVRISWAKNGVLTTVVDDFYDVGGSQKELLNLIHLIEKWDVNLSVDSCSENVRIIFSALQGAINEIGEKAFIWQRRDVTSHVIEIWLSLLRSMMKETEWSQENATPTIDEYIENGYVSFALGPIVLPALYLVGPELEEDIVRGPEYRTLFKLMGTSGRLLNDIHTFQRESKEGKLNAVSLHMIHNTSTAEEATQVLKDIVRTKMKELLRLVLTDNGSTVPRACKDLFWGMAKVLNLFYMTNDGFTSDELIDSVKSVIYKPVTLDALSLNTDEIPS